MAKGGDTVPMGQNLTTWKSAEGLGFATIRC